MFTFQYDDFWQKYQNSNVLKFTNDLYLKIRQTLVTFKLSSAI